MSYIDGLASGLDTTSIINSLMQLEARPKQLLESRLGTVKAGLDAYAGIRGRTSTVRTAATELASPTTWRALTATSSDPAAVAASAGAGTAGGSLSFTVEALAAAMQQSSADTFADLDADLDGRTLSITVDGQAHDFDSATTLGELVSDINDAGIGVKASTLQVTTGEHRLVLTAADTGVDNAFAITETGWTDPFATTRAAADAQLDVGGITVTRSSNTIDDLLAGATLTLKQTTTEPVTVEVARDVEGIGNQVEALVDALNGALDEIKLRTDYDPETNQRSSLTGDSTARSLAQSLTRALSDGVSQSELGSVGLAGINLTREGRFEFDAAAFTAAYEADPVAVERLFVAGADTVSGDVNFVSAGWRAAPGQHDIELRNIDGVWSGRIGGEEATVTENDDGSLRVAVASTNATMGGMTVRVGTTDLGGVDENYTQVGAIDYEPGAARRLTTATNRALDAVDGSLTTAEQTRENQVKDINRQIEAWEVRLDKREQRLRQQYTALESMLGQLQSQGQWLSGQIAQLTANNS